MQKIHQSTKPINNNSSIGFTNDNFEVFCSNYFLNYFPLANFKTNLSSAQNASPVFKNFKNSPSSAQITSPVFKNFKNNPSSALNASSLFCAPLTLGSKTTRACLCVASLRLLLKAFWLKSAVKADFLTPEPNITSNIASANGDINISSQNGTTTITSAADESWHATSTVDQSYNKISAGYDRGRVSVNSETKIDEADSKTTNLTQRESKLISGGNINIMARDDVNILASNLSSNDQINLTSTQGNVNILTQSNNSNFESETRQGTLTLSAGVGNMAIDTAYAEYDLYKAIKDLADAKKNLNHIETLHKSGKADSDAVSDAKINLTLAAANVALADLKLAASAAKAAESAKTLGFYADLTLTRTGQKTNTNSNNAQEIGSNLLAKNNILINSGMSLAASPTDAGNIGNTNIKGSIASVNGDINITSKNDTNITALKSTSNSSTKSEGFTQTVTLASSAAGTAKVFDQLINNLSASIGAGVNKSKSDASSTTYDNTTLLAQNGTLKINSGNFNAPPSSVPDGTTAIPLNRGNTTIKGANLLAENLTLNTQNNLSIESLQNSSNSKSKSKSFNAGVGGGSKSSGGGLSSISVGYNQSSSKLNRDWVDDQTSVIGTNSIQINTGANTNIKGALIANITNATAEDIKSNSNAEAKQKQANWIDGGNLILNTGTLTFENIYDREEKKSVGYGMQVSFAIGGKGETAGSNQAGSNQADARSSTSSTTTSSTNSQSNNQNIGTANSTNKQSTPDATITARNEGYKKEQTTKATIGGGTIRIGATQTFDSNGNLISSAGGAVLASNDPQIASLNRDIASTQIITKDTITGALNAKVSLEELVIAAKAAYLVSPLGVSEMIEDYTGKALTWEKGTEATFKEKGREFETAVDGANTVGKANVIPTDPSDPEYKPERLWLISQPLSADPKYKPNGAEEDGWVSKAANPIPGMNSMSVFHDKFTQYTFLGTEGLLELSIPPAMLINYYGLIGKSIRNTYEKPKNNNLTGVKND